MGFCLPVNLHTQIRTPRQWAEDLPLDEPWVISSPQMLTLSPPGWLYNTSAATSVWHFTHADNMLLFTFPVATSLWSRKCCFLSPLHPGHGEHSPCSRARWFITYMQFLPVSLQVEMHRLHQCKARQCAGWWRAAQSPWHASWVVAPLCTGTSSFLGSHPRGYCTCLETHLPLMTATIGRSFKCREILPTLFW